jgi:hypothetical protein
MIYVIAMSKEFMVSNKKMKTRQKPLVIYDRTQ